VIEIRQLRASHSGDLGWLFKQQGADYLRYFHPFAFDVVTLERVLSSATQDVYLGIYVLQEIVGLVMLRGWDDGYTVPALGIMLDYAYTGCGLSDMAIHAAKCIARLRNCQRIMLKVHPDNLPAMRLFRRHGFAPTGQDGDMIVMHHELSRPSLADLGHDAETVRAGIRERFGVEVTPAYAQAFVQFVEESLNVI
jgi:RimJ/RimL family protein N-acetyltransferase